LLWFIIIDLSLSTFTWCDDGDSIVVSSSIICILLLRLHVVERCLIVKFSSLGGSFVCRRRKGTFSVQFFFFKPVSWFGFGRSSKVSSSVVGGSSSLPLHFILVRTYSSFEMSFFLAFDDDGGGLFVAHLVEDI
jgi:hypothetical protein